jgi:hypothetical protein
MSTETHTDDPVARVGGLDETRDEYHDRILRESADAFIEHQTFGPAGSRLAAALVLHYAKRLRENREPDGRVHVESFSVLVHPYGEPKPDTSITLTLNNFARHFGVSGIDIFDDTLHHRYHVVSGAAAYRLRRRAAARGVRIRLRFSQSAQRHRHLFRNTDVSIAVPIRR